MIALFPLLIASTVNAWKFKPFKGLSNVCTLLEKRHVFLKKELQTPVKKINIFSHPLSHNSMFRNDILQGSREMLFVGGVGKHGNVLPRDERRKDVVLFLCCEHRHRTTKDSVD